MEGTEIYALGAALLVFEAIKWAVNRLLPHDPLSQEDKFYLRDLHKMHQKTDENGRPLWYMPTDMAETQKEILDILKDISHSQLDVARILERLATKL
jgi:hypothetical protein